MYTHTPHSLVHQFKSDTIRFLFGRQFSFFILEFRKWNSKEKFDGDRYVDWNIFAGWPIQKEALDWITRDAVERFCFSQLQSLAISLATVSIVNTDRRVNVHGSTKRKIPQHLYQLNVPPPQKKRGVAQPREMRTKRNESTKNEPPYFSHCRVGSDNPSWPDCIECYCRPWENREKKLKKNKK